MVELLDKRNMTSCLTASKVSIYNEHGADENWHPPWLLCVCKACEYITLRNREGENADRKTWVYLQYIRHHCTFID